MYYIYFHSTSSFKECSNAAEALAELARKESPWYGGVKTIFEAVSIERLQEEAGLRQPFAKAGDTIKGSLSRDEKGKFVADDSPDDDDYPHTADGSAPKCHCQCTPCVHEPHPKRDRIDYLRDAVDDLQRRFADLAQALAEAVTSNVTRQPTINLMIDTASIEQAAHRAATQALKEAAIRADVRVRTQ